MRPLHYVSSDQIRFQQSMHMRPRPIVHWRLLHVESGRGEFHLAGKHFEVSANWLGLLAPGIREYRYHAGEPVSYLFVEFQSGQDLIDDAYREFSAGEPQRSTLIAILKTIHAERSDPGGCLLAAAVRLMLPEQSSRAEEPTDPRLGKVLRQIDRRPDQNPTLAELATIAGVSEPHLRRLFRTHLGVSPKQYLMRTRMAFAQRLLRYEGMRVGQAAALLGFASVYQFSAQFRQVMGHPPSADRRG
ncbi:AraC family transcriptional regulator [Lignipirellula cremea]|uniref:HTH-type transcriptional activator Btr n=1 Tax=Lignipirellula cremea TaxID=2528010 RepID=A0A518E2W8_9BACT|nr:AraC family transcriptional regulator [Lignipirellula cremea]QDU98431.1 HTH-type transcriptional activator Btr [Lignipirellula cremea]